MATWQLRETMTHNGFQDRRTVIDGITYAFLVNGKTVRFSPCGVTVVYNWIEYSIAKDAAQLDSAFTTKGFRNWTNATKLLDKHQFSKSHLTSSTSLHQYVSGKPIDVILDKTKNLSLKQRETDRIMNRKYMERLIDITIFLGKTGKSFRGHNEKDESNNKGFLELTDFLTKNHLENGSKNAQYTSNYIQNDIIQSINNLLKQKLTAIFKNKFVSIMADETSDCGHYEQFSIVIRCYDSNKNRPVEYFVGLLRLMSTNSQSIFDSLNSCVGNFGIPWSSVISVCFDGAAAMAGCYNGVQMKCREKNENIFYVHCYAHCLNLVLIDSIGHKNRVLLDFFGTVQLIYAFLEGSSTQHAVLEKVAKEVNTELVTLKSLSTTRWTCRYEAVAAIKLNYTALVKTLENIYEDTKLPDIRAKTKGIIKQMKSFNFIFSLNMMYAILKLIVKAKQLNLLSATSLITSLNTSKLSETVQSCTLEKISIRKRKVSCLLESKNSSSQIFHETMEQEIKINCFNVALDNMTSELNDSNVLQLSPTVENIKLLNKVFAIDMDKLEQEIKLLKGFTDIPCGSSTTTIDQ
ncbi:zinc finger MYM-type protein 1-like [Aphis craccivora]|uniref:Zinc finger MYM-type protein 1-like n=1 Tax=Aphis craccivora TaxID=307492 RepID=A0A6G0Y3F2_APHCR|nr:zinc finger MYM-type protein 1-like [Aphis craccivora]